MKGGLSDCRQQAIAENNPCVRGNRSYSNSFQGGAEGEELKLCAAISLSQEIEFKLWGRSGFQRGRKCRANA